MNEEIEGREAAKVLHADLGQGFATYAQVDGEWYSVNLRNHQTHGQAHLSRKAHGLFCATLQQTPIKPPNSKTMNTIMKQTNALNKAAPELLEACQQALFAIPTTHCAFETIRAAIAKAQGNSEPSSAPEEPNTCALYNCDTPLWANTNERYARMPNGGPILTVREGHVDSGHEVLARFSTSADACACLITAGFAPHNKPKKGICPQFKPRHKPISCPPA